MYTKRPFTILQLLKLNNTLTPKLAMAHCLPAFSFPIACLELRSVIEMKPTALALEDNQSKLKS